MNARLAAQRTGKIAAALAGALILLTAALSAENFPHDRLIAAAQKHADWPGAGVVRQLELIRNAANAQPIASDPVSDRYTITFLGGPIDWVHFLNLANFVFSGKEAFGDAQYRQWVSEGGPRFEAGKTRSEPTAATPDDLPSNALGALFGRELRAAGKTDVPTQLRAFIAPFRPVPDVVAKRFSRDRIVLGLAENSGRQALDRAHAWFTAEPLNLTTALNRASQEVLGKQFGQNQPSGRAMLREAGFELAAYRGKPVVIRRIAR